MPRKVFTAGEILTAANLNDVSDQSVMVFDDATARTTAIPTPVEGMVTYLSDVNQVQAFTGSAFTPVGGILQVLSTSKTDAFTMSSTTFTTLLGLTVQITPSSATSKILVMVDTNGAGSNTTTTNLRYRLMRNSTSILLGDAAGTRTRATFGGATSGNAQTMFSVAMSFLDSPNTTSAVTYSVDISASQAFPIFVNRSVADGDADTRSRSASTITVMEVAG